MDALQVDLHVLRHMAARARLSPERALRVTVRVREEAAITTVRVGGPASYVHTSTCPAPCPLPRGEERLLLDVRLPAAVFVL